MSNFPDLTFITGVQITTNLNQEPSTRNVFNIKEATIPEFAIAEKEPLPKNVTQNNERIFSNIAKIFSKSKNSNKNKLEEENKFTKTSKDTTSMGRLNHAQLKPISNQVSYKKSLTSQGTLLKPNSRSALLPMVKEKSVLPPQSGTLANEKMKDTTSDRVTKFEKVWKKSFEGPINKSIIANFFWYTLCVFKEGEEIKKLEEKFIEAAEFQKSKDKASENWRSRERLSEKFEGKRVDLGKKEINVGGDRRYSSKERDMMIELEMTQSKLLDNIAGNYIELTLQIDPKFRDKFFETYYDCLAQAVYYCYFFAYPQSRNDILSEEFMNFLFRIISEQITGMPICNRGFESWSFDLGAGNILEKGKIKKSTLPTLTGTNEGPERKNSNLLHMRYSPLVNRFMKNRKYEGYNALNDWKMRYTLRNPKQRDIDIKMKEYTGLAVETVKKTKERFATYEEESQKIDEEISNNKAYIQKVTALMESRTQAILKHNSREYANLLVSLRGEWQTYEND